MTDLEVLCTLVAAAVHDVGHPGIDNKFHVASKHELALLYNDRSVLENYHAAYAFRLLRQAENNVLAGLSPQQYDEARKLIIDLVLGTDLGHHFEFFKEFKTHVGPLASIMAVPKSKLNVLKMSLKCADVGHTAKSNKLHLVWTERVCEEFYRQGDQERRRGLPISPFMDRRKPNVPKAQLGFIDFLVRPMYEAFLSQLAPSIDVESARAGGFDVSDSEDEEDGCEDGAAACGDADAAGESEEDEDELSTADTEASGDEASAPRGAGATATSSAVASGATAGAKSAVARRRRRQRARQAAAESGVLRLARRGMEALPCLPRLKANREYWYGLLTDEEKAAAAAAPPPPPPPPPPAAPATAAAAGAASADAVGPTPAQRPQPAN